MSARPSGRGGLGRRTRRLTLAPSLMPALHPSPQGCHEKGQTQAQRCEEGRAALSKFVSMVAEVTTCPKKAHAVPILSKFWSQGDDSEESDDEEIKSPSTPQFVKEAVEARFTEDQLIRAERAMSSGNETCEKLGTIGTTANLLVYLTTVYGMSGAGAAALLSLWSGTVNLAPLLGAFLSDSYLGRYATIAFASLASFLGMIILTLTAAVPALHPNSTAAGAPHPNGPSSLQMAVLLASFALLAVGAGGIRPCNLAFGADQFDPRTPAGRLGINSFFNWYYFTFTIAMMISATVIIYLQSNVSWALGLAVPATLMGLSCALFFMGTRLYVRVRPEGSPFTSFAQVLAAFHDRRPPTSTTRRTRAASSPRSPTPTSSSASTRPPCAPPTMTTRGGCARCSRWRRSSAWRGCSRCGPPASSTTSCSPTSATTTCSRPCRRTATLAAAASRSPRAPSSSSTCWRSRCGSPSTTACSCRPCSASPSARAASPSCSGSDSGSCSPSSPCSSPPPSRGTAGGSATPPPASCSCHSRCSPASPRHSPSSGRSTSITNSSQRTCAASPGRCSSWDSPSPATPAGSWSASCTGPPAATTDAPTGWRRTSTRDASTSSTCSSPPWPRSTLSTSSSARAGTGSRSRQPPLTPTWSWSYRERLQRLQSER